MEIWKDVELKGYEGSYQVSNLERIKSFKWGKERILKATRTRGYLTVHLSSKSKRKNMMVHQLVAIAFLNHKPCGYKLVVDHVNDVGTDNIVENLQVVTQRFNARKTQGNYSSQYKGVYWCKRGKKWKVAIRINGKKKHLGYFTDEEEASKAYQSALLTIQKTNRCSA